MSVAGFAETNFEDYGLENYGLASTDNDEPEDWSTEAVLGFGAQIDQPVAMLDGAMGLAMEYDSDDFVSYAGGPLVRTKMLEICPEEIATIRRRGRPTLGAVALSDDGDIYQWTEVRGLGGFFKKLRKKFKKVSGKVIKRASKFRKRLTAKAKKLIKKLPGGKYLVKIYDRVKAVGMKLTKPLKKLLGSKVGKFLGPIAAMIPGAGPVVAGAIAVMRRKGQIEKALKKLGVKRNKKGQPKFKSGAQAKALQKELTRLAKQSVKQSRKSKGSKQLIKRGSPEHSRRLRGLGLAGV